jgi:hypothetical protein
METEPLQLFKMRTETSKKAVLLPCCDICVLSKDQGDTCHDIETFLSCPGDYQETWTDDLC